ncbi:MAG TPA: cell wall hydrolase [Mobilitalea sp.]|nr:cell wall hydrolase [Mobilitalea sp.]
MKIKRALFSTVFLSVYCIFIFIGISKIAVNKNTALTEADNENLTEYLSHNESIAYNSTRNFIYEKYQIAKTDENTLGTDGSRKNVTLKESEAESVLTFNDENSIKEVDEANDLIRELLQSDFIDIGISVANTYVNIREKASTDSSVKGKLYKDCAVKILDTVGDWYFIESGNVKGYVKSKYIKTNIQNEELTEKYGTLRIAVNTDSLNVRKSPDVSSERIAVISRNECYSVTGLLGEWVQIEISDKKITGYVNRKYVNFFIEFKTAISLQEEEGPGKSQKKKEYKNDSKIDYRDPFDYTKEDLKLLACLVYAEAGNQSYEGKLAVANVVLNRVKSSKFPDTIKEVIYQPGQFTVAKNGSLAKQLKKYENYSSKSQLQAIKAAKAALEGENNIGSRLYFNEYKASVKKGYHKNKNCIRIDDQLFW